MKILQIIPGFWVGGAEVMCKNLLLSLKALGHEVAAVSLFPDRTDLSQQLEEAGVRVYYLDKQIGLDVSMVPKLVKIIRGEKPHAVNSHLDCIKYAVLAARLAGVKKVFHTIHSLAEKECEGRAQKIINTTYFKLGFATPVALSGQVRDSIAAFYGLNPEKIPVIPNGIDLDRCTPKESYEMGETVELVHVGRFDLPKNHVGMLKAFKRLHDQYPQCRLTLVGDGDLREEIEKTIAELEIAPWVSLAGMQKDVYPYLKKADIFTLPSVYEGNPMSIIEAMGFGLPIAASRVGGIPDMIQDGKTGLLFEPQPEAICQGWMRLMESQSLRKTLGENARRDSGRFSARTMAQRYTDIYE